MDQVIEWKESGGAITFSVKVVPRSSRTEIAGTEGDALRIRLKAPPVEGRANEALIEFLANTFRIGKANVEIVRGETGRHKLVRLKGVRGEQLVRIVQGE